jgi:hypothetical protein
VWSNLKRKKEKKTGKKERNCQNKNKKLGNERTVAFS